MKRKTFVRLLCTLMLVTLCGSVSHAQVGIPGTRIQYKFPSKWKYLSSQKIDANTMQYLYCYTAKTIVSKGDTALPFLRIYVRKNYTPSVYEFVFERYNKEPS